MPLPEGVVKILEENVLLLKTVMQLMLKENVELSREMLARCSEVKTQLDEAFVSESEEMRGVVNTIWSFGPRHTGPNVLFNSMRDYPRPSIWDILSDRQCLQQLRDYDNSIISGFQLATLSGPLCEEPMHRVGIMVSEWALAGEENRDVSDMYSPFSGQLISAMEGCRRSMLAQPTRLVAIMCNYDIRVS